MKTLGSGTAVLAAMPSADARQERIKVGVITNAEGAHVDLYFSALAETQEVESVVLADPSGKVVSDARKRLGNKLTATYDSFAAMLDRETPVLALVSLEARLAPPAVEAALNAGCHVVAGKPARAGNGFRRLPFGRDGTAPRLAVTGGRAFNTLRP